MRRLLPHSTPYLMPALLAIFTGLGLWADALTHSPSAQRGLGLLSFIALAIAAWSCEPPRRRQIWLLVLVSTGIELFGSVLWGAYRYRFGNVPLYVPPGHGLVYLFSIRLAATPLFERRFALLRGLALGGAVAWSLAGLTLAPRWGWRLDLFGAICLPIFAGVVLLTPRGPLFVAAFFATSALEVLGTAVGDWSWAAVTPVVPIPTGNPPSVVAGLYCCLDALVLVSYRAVASAARRLRPGRRAPASELGRSTLV
ncbi:MAG: hypothetical protein NVSMB29_04010 [Candidatus Dormibacteria bacterium]